MSRQEMKDEYKETEGNPVIKGRIRRLQRQMRRRRMLDDTKRAAVVITNPTDTPSRSNTAPICPRPSSSLKDATCSPPRSGKSLAGKTFRWSRIRRWRTSSTAPLKSDKAFPPVSMRSLPKSWRLYTAPRRAPSPPPPLPQLLLPQPPLPQPPLPQKETPLMPTAAVSPGPLTRNQFIEWIVPIAAVSLVFVMLVPLPSIVLDLLLATSIAASVLVLLSALQILRPAQFSVFPSLLLLLTLFRLSLNLASSRRILLHGNEGAGAAGRVIEAFGQFVVGGNYVVGFVLFIALIAIQYIVVSHGAVRTAEVTARFTLDALPGKQMAIDADLNAGLIDEHQARARREQTAREAEFYGAMDGAARFNQRDSIATILITGINILAGFLIGVFQLDIPFREALKTYTVLTVGDGLVTMIPSLLVSMAGGMVVTRASSSATLSADLGTQLLSRPRSLQIAAGVMVALACIPGLPKFSFLAIAAVVALLAARLPKPVKDKDGKVIEVPDPGALPRRRKRQESR